MKWLFSILIFLPFGLWAQPGTDIYLIDLHLARDSSARSAAIQNITLRSGYDNQPWFTSDGTRILYTSMTKDSTTDIFEYSIITKKTSRLTKTPLTSEYSPRLSADEKRMRVVRVEEDGTTQRLWDFPYRSKGKPVNTYPWLDSVGYYFPVDSVSFYAFILGNNGKNHTLRYVSENDKQEVIIEDSIGRCFYHSSENGVNNTLLYTVFDEDGKVSIRVSMHEDPDGLFAAGTPGNVEDFVVYKDQLLLLFFEGKLFKYNEDQKGNPSWEIWMDLSDFELKGVTRLASSSDGRWMAIVAADAK